MLTPRRPAPFALRSALATVTVGALVAGCGSDSPSDSPSDSASSGSTYAPTVENVDEPESRLAVTYDGGVLVLRAADGEVLEDVAMDGFLRVSPAGDERHVFVSRPGSFTALDLGAWSVDHGDHGHSYVDTPELTEFSVPAEQPGHVVTHHGATTLFDDATGTVTSFTSRDLGSLDQEPELTTSRTAEPHHGVAVTLEDGSSIRTVGNVDERSGIEVVDAAGAVVAATDACPGVHGETFAREVAVFGCEDGMVVVDGTEITKAAAPDAYARSGNLSGSAESPYVLGDYKTDPDAELERPTRVSILDTRDASMQVVELGTSYSFRSLGRTPDGNGLVLGTDGALHVVDPVRGEVTDSVDVVAPWEEPIEWEQARPALEVVGDLAYVTEPASSALHVIDLTTLRVVETYPLPEVPNEIVGVTG